MATEDGTIARLKALLDEISPAESMDMYMYLAIQMYEQYQADGRASHLDNAVELARETLSGRVAAEGAARADELNNLGVFLEAQFKRVGRLDDLEEAIEVTRRAVQSTPKDSPNLALSLNNLGNQLERRFERLGKLDNLEEAIEVTRQAVQSTPKDSPNLASSLNNLGNQLERRFARLGRLDDLEEAIGVIRQAVQSTPKDSPNLASWLNNLGSKLERRFERLGRLDDLEEAIGVIRQAVQSTPKDSPNLVSRLNNLGNQLEIRFERLGRLDDLEEAIEVTRRAVQSTPEDSPDLASWLNNLGTKLKSRFERLGRLDNLEEAIEVTRQAVQSTPKDSPNLASWLNNLGNQLETRSEYTHDSTDLTAAGRALKQAWDCKNALPFHRIIAATACIDLLKRQEAWEQALSIATGVLDLLPATSSRALSRHDQQDAVALFAGVAGDACALRLMCGEGSNEAAEEALELLERGRGAVLGLAMDDRTDISSLQASYSQQAARFETIRVALNQPRKVEESGESQARLRQSPVKLLEEFNTCVEEIRSLPGHGDFLQAPSIKAMMTAAADGVIALVNVSNFRSDAILVTRSGVRSLPLPRLTQSNIRSWLEKRHTSISASESPDIFGRKNKSYRGFLRWLWISCVKRIFDDLNINGQASDDLLPRVWWIGTGLASALPFHAAGDHSIGGTENTLERAISSYIPTIRSLIHSRRRALKATNLPEHLHSLLVATMSTTPDEPDLPGVLQEADEIKAVVAEALQVTIEPQPSARQVLELMRKNDIFHFAGHGSSDPHDPADSCLVLEKPDDSSAVAVQDPLSVGQLLEVDIQPALLAFLSACSTAENQAYWLADEVIHLASGFLVAGFSHVVACLWPSNDAVCVEVTKAFYRKLDISSGAKVADIRLAMAMHVAVKEVRSRWREEPLLWVQYVHLGA